MANSRPDYVYVQLTQAGVAFAGGVPLRVSGSKRSFVFEGETPQEVERSAEWRGILSHQTTADGTALFQLAPQPSQPIAAAVAQPATPAPAKGAPSAPSISAPAATAATTAAAAAAAAKAAK